jgi:isopentenyl-diphosphate delta-isomerase
MVKENVILVDKDDKPLGLMEKMEAHEKAVMHRAFSVFIFNDEGKLMLQQRALHKYHSPGLWTNTVCSHPRDGESSEEAAHRRIVEEMGFDCSFEEAFSFVYKAEVGQGLTEHEFDHVFIGVSNLEPTINPDEVASWKYADLQWLETDVANNPQDYTEWFKIALERVLGHFTGNGKSEGQFF